ncbi:MAG: FG-GAP-like repeat-containing protein, partial [Candidatus Bathyarchaeota archaeon]|nr:FG-GAP-like repeat-containing protein [Candidatus Bathyarchaeota archaeon]
MRKNFYNISNFFYKTNSERFKFLFFVLTDSFGRGTKINNRKKFLSVLIIFLLAQSLLSLVNIAQVSGQLMITLKWRASAGTGSTWLGPLAADLNNDGKMEIVISGLTGQTAALDPETGGVIWSVPYGGDHVPMEIVDLNNDGFLEIVMCPQYVNGVVSKGVMVLHGCNGSIWWYNTQAAGKGTYVAVADINDDDYLEIFSAFPGLVTALTYDGRIFAKTYTYYTCSGGMSIGDTDFDGVFEVYLGERSESYPSYPSGGRGLRAFWADNLTERWSYPEILCSSQVPVLADVDKDGDLEIIIQYQRGGGGIGVFNTDGSVNTYNGKYRKSINIGYQCHSNGPVADVDADGNLELISCGDAHGNWYPPKIWDLVDWTLDATLPFTSMEPPGVVDIDGDGKLEIVAPNEKNITIFKYNQNTKNYDSIYAISLPRAHPFFIAQDIDGDGYLELVFNQYNSWISIYDTNTLAPTPLPRSERYFYSEYRTRVPVYLPPPDQSPRIVEFSPADGATNVLFSLSELSFKLIDYQNELMSYTVTTNPDIGSASGINVPNGKIIVPVRGLAPSTTYTCTVTAADGKSTTKRTFIFYTEGTASLTISTTPVGTGSVIKNPDKATYAYGERVQLTAVATDPLVYKLSKWGDDLAWMGSNNPATIIMDGDKSVTAEFTKIQYTLSISISPTGSGSVTLNSTGPYYYGDAVELTAVPNTGWSFFNWTRDLTGNQNPATIIINGNKRVTANFVEETPVEYVLSVSVEGSGSVTKSPDKPAYSAGTEVTLTAVAADGWVFDHWVGDLSGSANPATITVDSAKLVTAVFVEET